MSEITIERLRRFDIFGDLTDDELAQIVPLCREESHGESDVVLVEDAPAQAFFVVERGKLSLEKKLQLGRRGTVRTATIGIVGPGGSAGWSTLTAPDVYTSTAVCLEPTCLIALNGDALLRLMQANPRIGYKVMSIVARVARARYQNATDTLAYFLSVVSHELRAPLGAIQNYLQVILEGFAGELTDKQRRMLGRSVLRINDLRSLIGDLVDLARLRPEQIQADFEWMDPGEVGSESIEDVRLAAGEKNIRIRIEPPAQFEPLVGARRRLRQVFTNLLTNAVKFSPPDSVVTFRARYEPDALIFEVEDEGIGSPPEDQTHIFEDFFRGENVGDVSGAGLGLSIAHKIMEAHRGEIRVRSPYVEGKTGTRFTVVIPLDLQTPEMRRKAPSGGIDPPSDMPGDLA